VEVIAGASYVNTIAVVNPTPSNAVEILTSLCVPTGAAHVTIVFVVQEVVKHMAAG